MSGSITLKPGLSTTAATQTGTVKGSETSCTPSKTSGGSGAFTSTIKITNGSCAKLVAGGTTFTGTGSTTWKNKKVSKYSLTYKDGKGSSITVITITGKVTSGLFVGKKFSGQIKITVPSSENCTAGHPVKTMTYKNSKPFVLA